MVVEKFVECLPDHAQILKPVASWAIEETVIIINLVETWKSAALAVYRVYTSLVGAGGLRVVLVEE